MHRELGSQAGHLEHPADRVRAVRVEDGIADVRRGGPALPVHDHTEDRGVDEGRGRKVDDYSCSFAEQGLKPPAKLRGRAEVMLAADGKHRHSCIGSLESELPSPHTGDTTLIGGHSNLLLRTY